MNNKKSAWYAVLAAGLMALCSTGCASAMEETVEMTHREQGRVSAGVRGELVEGTRQATLEVLRTRQAGKYAYQCLKEQEQVLYVEILAVLQEFGADLEVSTLSEDELSYVFQCVMNDHPELFYVEGYTFTKYTVGDKVSRITLTGAYTCTQEEAREKQAGIDKYVQDCFAGLPQAADEYEKVKYLYEYLIKHTEYSLQSEENQNICSVFLNGVSVCQGYAKALQYLLDRQGISSTLVVGYVENGDGHAWNLVQVDGAYYYVDPTWGDASYELSGNAGEAAAKLPSINYDYLCVTTDQLTVTHTIDNVVPMPRCVQMKDNYYVREGAYFTDCAEEKLKALFEKAYGQGMESVTLKCADGNVYKEMKRILLEEQKVFTYLKDTEGSVAYTDNDAQMTISFWL